MGSARHAERGTGSDRTGRFPERHALDGRGGGAFGCIRPVGGIRPPVDADRNAERLGQAPLCPTGAGGLGQCLPAGAERSRPRQCAVADGRVTGARRAWARHDPGPAAGRTDPAARGCRQPTRRRYRQIRVPDHRTPRRQRKCGAPHLRGILGTADQGRHRLHPLRASARSRPRRAGRRPADLHRRSAARRTLSRHLPRGAAGSQRRDPDQGCRDHALCPRPQPKRQLCRPGLCPATRRRCGRADRNRQPVRGRPAAAPGQRPKYSSCMVRRRLRSLTRRSMQEEYFGRPLSQYEDQLFSSQIAEEIWTGTGEVQNEQNRTMTTRLPMGDILADQPPGIYALTARVPGQDSYEDPGSTQWFVLTDLGLTTLKGTDGLHVFVRGLGDAAAREGVELTLLSRANRVLGTLDTDADGHALFAAGLTRGNAGAAPAMVLAKSGAEDMAFLSLTDPAFDLSDRGVEGRPPAPPVDVFLATDRGAYRAGETIHATALARDGVAKAITGLPLTAILKRPDGVEYARHLSAEDSAGGHVFTLPIGATVPRGSWTLDIKADVD